jgi:hypothetical protein
MTNLPQGRAAVPLADMARTFFSDHEAGVGLRGSA